MTGTPSTWPNWVDAVLAAMRATTGYKDPSSTATGIPVYDGPEVYLTADTVGSYLVIGYSGTDEEPDSPGSADQTEATSSPLRSKDEMGIITCYACAQSGDNSITNRSVKKVRDQAFAMVAAVEISIRTAPDEGLIGLGQVRLLQFRNLRVEQWAREGVVCAITFDIQFQSRI